MILAEYVLILKLLTSLILGKTSFSTPLFLKKPQFSLFTDQFKVISPYVPAEFTYSDLGQQFDLKMKRSLSLILVVIIFSVSAVAQDVFSPSDPIVRYNAGQPLGSPQHPNPDIPGLQKWVSVPVKGVSADPGSWDASSFKQYFLNVGGTKVAFRVKFPTTYSSNPSKKFPVMLFLHGGGEVGCPTNGGIYNNERPIWLGGQLFRDKVNSGAFDGFLLYPQLVINDVGCFAGWLAASSQTLDVIISMIDSMAKYVRADVDRVSVDGLSGGGFGAWRMAKSYPKRIAKILPSAASGAVSTNERLNMIHVPIWFATGGKDVDPSPEMAATQYNAFKAIGANIRYTEYPELGHNMWYNHWREPDFVPELLSAHKANPLVYFGRNAFCRPDEINAKLGLTAGFDAYEWEKDGVLIASSDNGINTILVPSVVISYTGNEINVRQYGHYRARFRRYAGGSWSAWSPNPVDIKTKSTTQTPPIQIEGKHSKVLPAPDGSVTVPLGMPEGFVNYQWYTDTSTAAIDTFRVYNAGIGQYKARYSEEFGCGTEFSPLFHVIDADGSPKPDPATQLTAAPASAASVKLNWSQNNSPAVEETGFEVYRSTATTGPYTFVNITAPNITTYTDTGLIANTPYFYMIRAVGDSGAAAVSNKAPVKTLGDNTPPTAPGNLIYASTPDPSVVTLGWGASSDAGGIARYDIFINGEKAFSTTALSYQVTGLDSGSVFNFVVKAYDTDGNVSPPSNQVTYSRDPNAPPIPGIPRTIVATAKSYSIINVTWVDSSSNESGFEIARSPSPASPYKNVGVVGPDVTIFSDSSLAPSTIYYYKVRAIGTGGESDYSDTSSATTFGPPLTPVAPTELAGDSGDSTSISITWTDNASNETGYLIYRSTDSVSFTVIDSVPSNTNAYTDTTISGQQAYYYYVVGINGSGEGDPSNTIVVYSNNRAPVISGLSTFTMKSLDTVAIDFTVMDDVGDSVNTTVPERPLFVTFYLLSPGKYRLVALPQVDDIGSHFVTVKAMDNKGKSSEIRFQVIVSNKNFRSTFVRFGNPNSVVSAPWNNFSGTMTDSSSLSNIIDENGENTSYGIRSMSNWGISTMGHITGDNSGIFPDFVLESGIVDSSSGVKTFQITGLDPSKMYNLVFAGSQNEGYVATSEISTVVSPDTLRTISDARNNMHTAASLNGLKPTADGIIEVNIKRGPNSPASYLNALVIKEYENAVELLSPQNLFVEAKDRNAANLTWLDNSANEDNEGGFELIRATDSSFVGGTVSIPLPANTTSYTDTSLKPNTNYYYHVRAKSGSQTSGFSNKARVITPEALAYVNFNSTVANAPFPWNNIASPVLVEFTTPPLFNQSGANTPMTMSLVKTFNGEFTSGAATGNNSGVVPDLVLKSNFWLDRGQVSQFKVNGLNHNRKYRVGFIGSSGPAQWYKSNYTAAYTVDGKTVYLNSWMNSTKVVYVENLQPEEDGTLMLNFSTTPAGGYGFNSGVIIEQYTDTLKAIADSIPKYIPPPVDPNDPDPPNNPGNPGDPNNPGDTTIYPPPTIDTLPPDSSRFDKITVYPNPFYNQLNLRFYNGAPNARINLEIYDELGQLKFRRDFGNLPQGNVILPVTSISVNMRVGVYIMVLKRDGKIVKSQKIVRLRN